MKTRKERQCVFHRRNWQNDPDCFGDDRCRTGRFYRRNIFFCI